MIEVNYVAILLAAIAAMAVGFLWYSPYLLGKPWMKERGLTPEKLKGAQKEMGMMYGISFVLALVSAYVLSHVISMSLAYFNYPALTTGLTSAFWMWLGFIMPVQATATIFGNKNWKLFGIDTGHQLVAILVMGVVLALV